MQFLGGFLQSCLPLLDRTDNNNNHVAGRLNIPALTNLFGAGSFNHPLDKPWETFLNTSDESGNLVCGLRHAWSQLQSNYQDVATNDELSNPKLLLTQELARAGFYEDGSVAKSVTNALTIELEGSRSRSLGNWIADRLDRKSYERWSWEAWRKSSAVFLHSPPDQFGYIEDQIFPVAVAQYLGQPCPMMAPVVGRFFGKDGQVLDEYGANLAAASLPGQGHRALHNTLQSILQDMMKLAGI